MDVSNVAEVEILPVSEEGARLYKSFDLLAVEDIIRILNTEMKVTEQDQKLNNNAPFAVTDPDSQL